MLPSRLFLDDMFDFGEPRPHGPRERMDCDIYEKDGKYFLEASVFGFNKDEIKIECEDGSIIISAEKKEDHKESDDKKYIRREISYGKLSRTFYVGDTITEDEIKASYKNGILTVTVPKVSKIDNKKVIQIED